MAFSRRAAKAWDDAKTYSYANWWDSPRCRGHYNKAVCGQAVEGLSEGPRKRLEAALAGRKLTRGLSVGCGAGAKEIALLIDGLVESFDLWEIAQSLADNGLKAAADAGLQNRVTYHIGDAFKTRPEAVYDLVYWDHSLHHMSDVAAALEWSLASLRPGGFLLINDYVGPNRLQMTREEVDFSRAFLRRVGIDVRLPYPSIVSWLRQWKRDPSEAPQSELIPASIERILPGSKLEPIGGTFLNMLGGIIVPRVDDSDPIMTLFLEEDATLRERGWSHFAFVLWQKPTTK